MAPRLAAGGHFIAASGGAATPIPGAAVLRVFMNRYEWWAHPRWRRAVRCRAAAREGDQPDGDERSDAEPREGVRRCEEAGVATATNLDEARQQQEPGRSESSCGRVSDAEQWA